MKINLKLSILFVIIPLTLFIVSSCGVFPGTVASSTPIAKPKPASTEWSNGQKAMDGLSAVHSLMNMALGSSAFSTISPSTDTSTSSVQLSVTMKDDGDTVKPGQASETLTMRVNVGPTTLNYGIKQITKGDKVYMQNPNTSNWYVLDSKTAANSSSNPFAISQFANFDTLMSGAASGKLTDHGIEKLQGVNLRHITALLAANETKNIFGTSAGEITAADKTTVDLWIDDATSYIHRLEMKFIVPTTAPSTSGPTTSTAPAANVMDLTIDYSNFNKTVTIPIPSGATPTNDVGDVLK